MIDAALIAFWSFAQHISFTVASRARNRGHRAYSNACAFTSALLWFIAFRAVDNAGWGIEYAAPFSLAAVLGTHCGSVVSEKIERRLKATADGHIV